MNSEKPRCRNDCTEPLLFPRRPNNRPGEFHIDYRIGTYSDFLEAVLRKLNADPLLGDWTHRGADDPGIALLEGASILGDILTFYQELYANETYLRTAQWRESIADLVRLSGYRLSPGLGGKATFAFEVKGDKPVVIPAGFPIKAQVEGSEKLVDFETTKETIAHPSLSKFNLYRRLYTPMVTQHTNEFYIFSPDQYPKPMALEKGDRLLVGDPYPSVNPTRLINGEIVIVDEIRELHGRKLFKIKGGLKRTGSSSEIVAFKLGRSFRHFGHNAPRKIVSIPSGGSAVEDNISYIRSLSTTTASIETPSLDLNGVVAKRIVDPALHELNFPLDNEVNDLSIGNQFLIQGLFLGWNYNTSTWATPKEFTLVRTITNVKSISMTWGAVSGATSLVSLDGKLTTFEGNSWYYATDIRHIQFQEVISPLLRLRAGVEETSQVKGNQLYFYGTGAEVQSLKDRLLLFEKPGEDTFTATVVSVQSLSSYVSDRPLLRRITLDQDVDYGDFPNANPIVTVYGNLANATQGKTEKEAVLGNGDSRQKFQTFKLPKAPLTYLNTSGQTPPEVPKLQIYVNDRLWTMVPSFFGHGPKEEIYIVREDANGDSWVQFGDGKTGTRLPSGIKNVVARYRTSTGAYGALKEGTTVQPGGKLDRLDKIQLPGVVSGGSEPESGDNAKEAAPGKIQSLGRLVSLKDFESEALAISGVSKVRATWDIVNNIPTVVLTVLMEKGRSGEIERCILNKEKTCYINKEVQDIINGYNGCRGPRRFPVRACQGKRRYVYIDVVFSLHPAYREELVKKAIKEALGATGEEGNGIDGSRGLFGLNQRRFGQNEYATRIEGIVQNVEGVTWVKVTALGSFDEDVDDPKELALPSEPKSLNLVIPCDNEYVLSLCTAHLQLSVAVGESKEVC